MDVSLHDTGCQPVLTGKRLWTATAEPSKRHRIRVLPWVFSDWWTPSHGGGYREGVVIRHNELIELDLTVTHGWTF